MGRVLEDNVDDRQTNKSVRGEYHDPSALDERRCTDFQRAYPNLQIRKAPCPRLKLGVHSGNSESSVSLFKQGNFY